MNSDVESWMEGVHGSWEKPDADRILKCSANQEIPQTKIFTAS